MPHIARGDSTLPDSMSRAKKEEEEEERHESRRRELKSLSMRADVNKSYKYKERGKQASGDDKSGRGYPGGEHFPGKCHRNESSSSSRFKGCF